MSEVVKGVTKSELMEAFLSSEVIGDRKISLRSVEVWFKNLAEKHAHAVLEDYIKSNTNTTYGTLGVDVDWCKPVWYNHDMGMEPNPNIRFATKDDIGGKETVEKEEGFKWHINETPEEVFSKHKEYGRVYSDLESKQSSSISTCDGISRIYGKESSAENLANPSIADELNRLEHIYSTMKGEIEPKVKKELINYDYECKAGRIEFYSSGKNSITDEDVKSVLRSAIKHIDGNCPDGFIRGGSVGVWYKRDLSRVTEIKDKAVKEKRYDTAAQLRDIEDKLKAAIPSSSAKTEVPRETKYKVGQTIIYSDGVALCGYKIKEYVEKSNSYKAENAFGQFIHFHESDDRVLESFDGIKKFIMDYDKLAEKPLNKT